jgi:hypothetical protein
MITNTFYNGIGARVTNTKTFACLTPDVSIAGCSAVESNVADDNIFFRHKTSLRRRINNQLCT